MTSVDPNGEQTGTLAPESVGFSRLVAISAGVVAPAGSVISVLIVMVLYAGFASPLVVLIAFAASLCCASSISELARRLPSAGSLYTFASHGLGPEGGFLTGWILIFGYALYLPAGIALTSAYTSGLFADAFHVKVDTWPLFIAIFVAVILVAYLGIRTSSSLGLLLVVTEVAIFAALAITVLVKVGSTHFSAATLSPASSPNDQFSDITTGMVYAIAAFAGFESGAALGEEARRTHRSIPASIMGSVVVVGIFYLLVVFAEVTAVGRHGILGFVQQPNPIGYLASRYWSPSVLWALDLVIVVTGLSFVIAMLNVSVRVVFAMGREGALPNLFAGLSHRQTPMAAIACVGGIALVLGFPLTYFDGGARTFSYLAAMAALASVLHYLFVNVATLRAFRTEFRRDFVWWRHLLVPGIAAVLFLFPLWAILDPRTHGLVNRLPFVTVGWLTLGIIIAALLRLRRPDRLATFGRVFVSSETSGQ